MIVGGQARSRKCNAGLQIFLRRTFFGNFIEIQFKVSCKIKVIYIRSTRREIDWPVMFHCACWPYCKIKSKFVEYFQRLNMRTETAAALYRSVPFTLCKGSIKQTQSSGDKLDACHRKRVFTGVSAIVYLDKHCSNHSNEH